MYVAIHLKRGGLTCFLPSDFQLKAKTWSLSAVLSVDRPETSCLAAGFASTQSDWHPAGQLSSCAHGGFGQKSGNRWRHVSRHRTQTSLHAGTTLSQKKLKSIWWRFFSPFPGFLLPPLGNKVSGSIRDCKSFLLFISLISRLFHL